MADIEMAVWAPSTPGAKVPADAARGEAWASSGGERGIRGVGSSLRVTAAPVPDGTVRVAPGAAVSPSPYPGHAAQSYSMYCYRAQTAPIVATGSSGSRTDAVIIRVDDAALVGTPPADPVTHQYARIAVIQGVPVGLDSAEALITAKGIDYPFVLLARVTLPPSTATVTAAMITDLREMVGGQELLRVAALTGISTQIPLTATALSSSTIFPAGFQPQWRAPSWATHMHIRMLWSGVAHTSPLDAGGCVVHYGLNATEARTDWRGWSPGGSNTRTGSARDAWTISQEVAIPSALRGQVIKFRPSAWRDSPLNGTTFMDSASGGELQVRFLTRAD